MSKCYTCKSPIHEAARPLLSLTTRTRNDPDDVRAFSFDSWECLFIFAAGTANDDLAPSRFLATDDVKEIFYQEMDKILAAFKVALGKESL